MVLLTTESEIVLYVLMWRLKGAKYYAWTIWATLNVDEKQIIKQSISNKYEVPFNKNKPIC